MRESHVEGVATHDGPRSCAATREGVGEASDRGTCGPGIEPRNAQIQDADAVKRCGRPHVRHRQREMTHGPARSETPCTYGTSLRENREICVLLGAVALRAASGRP
jgi:RNA-directed DNA polymerase